jgi:hypothetical protein
MSFATWLALCPGLALALKSPKTASGMATDSERVFRLVRRGFFVVFVFTGIAEDLTGAGSSGTFWCWLNPFGSLHTSQTSGFALLLELLNLCGLVNVLLIGFGSLNEEKMGWQI